MSYIENLLDSFFEFTSRDDEAGADLFVHLADGNQAIVQMPQSDGDALAGRYIIFSTGLSVKQDRIAAHSVVWGTPINLEVSIAKLEDWNAQAEATRMENALNYLERNGVARNFGQKAIESLADGVNYKDLGPTARYIQSVTLTTGWKLDREKASKIAEGLRLRVNSNL